MSSRDRSWMLASLLALAMASPAAASPDDPAKPPAAPPTAPPAPPPAAAGVVFTDPTGGISVEGPAGWALAKSKGSVNTWTTLATFSEAPTGSFAEVSARRATAITLAKLRAEVTALYSADSGYKVLSVNDLPSGGRRALPGIVVDAEMTKAAEPAPGAAPGAPPPPASTYKVRGAYFLGGETEYRVYVLVRKVLWPRMSGLVDRMIGTVAVKLAGSANAPRGEGTYRDEVSGFACRFPAGYGVRIPQRELHVVEFAPAGDGPLIGVFRGESPLDLEGEAKALVDYYKGDEVVGGEAEAGTCEVAGRSAALVTAHGTIGGKDQVFFVAVVKRESDTFRLRVAAPRDQEVQAKAVFDGFVKSFVLTNA